MNKTNPLGNIHIFLLLEGDFEDGEEEGEYYLADAEAVENGCTCLFVFLNLFEIIFSYSSQKMRMEKQKIWKLVNLKMLILNIECFMFLIF